VAAGAVTRGIVDATPARSKACLAQTLAMRIALCGRVTPQYNVIFFAQRKLVMNLRTLVAALLFGFAAPAFAQSAAPAPVAPHTCIKPDEHPGRLASDARRSSWVKTANAYLDCLKKYINDQQGAYNKVLEQGKPHLDATNASIEEYNKAVTQFKAYQDNGK
jgi:hypothetical protein